MILDCDCAPGPNWGLPGTRESDRCCGSGRLISSNKKKVDGTARVWGPQQKIKERRQRTLNHNLTSCPPLCLLNTSLFISAQIPPKTNKHRSGLKHQHSRRLVISKRCEIISHLRKILKQKKKKDVQMSRRLGHHQMDKCAPQNVLWGMHADSFTASSRTESGWWMGSFSTVAAARCLSNLMNSCAVTHTYSICRCLDTKGRLSGVNVVWKRRL